MSQNISRKISIVEIGPGQGNLINDLISIFQKKYPKVIQHLQFILVEVNSWMIHLQKERLEDIRGVPIYWRTINELKQNPVYGVVIANEMLDALPVERIIFRSNKVYRQGIKLINNENINKLEFTELSLTYELEQAIDSNEKLLGIKFLPEGIQDGWTTEIHTEIRPWFEDLSRSILQGFLIVIDYALDFKRYYNLSRSSGTLMSYRNNMASDKLLINPGKSDLTSHICVETLIHNAEQNNWKYIGHTSQGEALLSLGLAKKISSLGQLQDIKLKDALQQRESLLRLVDPLLLGNFKWFAFVKSTSSEMPNLKNYTNPHFLEEPD